MDYKIPEALKQAASELAATNKHLSISDEPLASIWKWVSEEWIFNGDGNQEFRLVLELADLPRSIPKKREIQEINEYENFEHVKKLTDSERVRFAKEMWTIELEDVDGGNVPGVHYCALTDRGAAGVGIGLLCYIHGQAGPHPEFFAVCKSEKAFHSRLKEEGFCTLEEISELTDEDILSIWRENLGKEHSFSR